MRTSQTPDPSSDSRLRLTGSASLRLARTSSACAATQPALVMVAAAIAFHSRDIVASVNAILAHDLLKEETVDIGLGLRNCFGIFRRQALCQFHRGWH